MNYAKKIVSIVCSGTLLALVFATSVFTAGAAQSPIRIEAETGKLVGTAKIATNSHASGGKYICEINEASGYPNKVIYTISKCTAGNYRIKMHYVSATNGRIRYQVNNGAILDFSFKLNMGNDWNWGPNSAQDAVDNTHTFTLKGDGTDTLMIQDEDPEGFAWVDWLELDPVTTGTTSAKVSSTAKTSSASKAAVSSQTAPSAAAASVASAISSVASSEETISSETAIAVSETSSSVTEASTATTSPSSTNAGFPWLIVIGIIVVVVGGALIVYFVVKNKKKA